jgi:iron complex transport system ATP-binding protein
MILRGEHISFKASGKKILDETNIGFARGKFHVIMGANGAGKSTLLKILAGSLKPDTGNVFLGKTNIRHFTTNELAQRRAVLSQHYSIQFPLSACEIVKMGRYPYYKSGPAVSDYAICKHAMDVMEITELADRDYATLSGGEAQKVQMSRVLAQIWQEDAQGDNILFLDEPVSHLDIKYQHQLLRVAKKCCANNHTVIAVLHDINLAMTYADHIIFMKSGAIVNETHLPDEVTTALLQVVFDVKAEIVYTSDRKPVFIF